MRFFAFILFVAFAGFPPPNAKAQELDVTEIVEAHEAYTARDSNRNRNRLLAALEDYQDDAAVETVQAYRAILANDIESGRYSRIRESALATAAHLEPVADVLPKLHIEAKFFAAIALFNGRQDSDAMIEMAHVQGLAQSIVDETGSRPDWATDLRWKAEAWRMAMEAYFMSTNARYPSEPKVQSVLDKYPYSEQSVTEEGESLQAEETLPRCPAKMVQKPRLRYSAKQAFKGMYGAVILGFQTDSDGRVVNPRVLASIPSEEFDQRSLDVVGQWRLEAENPEDVGVTCRLNNSNVVQPLTFSLN